jgi:hypothetical protein
MAIDIVSMQELLIKHDDYFGLSLAYNSSSEAKWNVLSQGGVEVHDSVSNLEIIDVLLLLIWSKPIWEALLIYVLNSNCFNLFSLKVDSIIIFNNEVIMILELIDQFDIECIETHFNVR